jgi:hypothetical protein
MITRNYWPWVLSFAMVVGSVHAQKGKAPAKKTNFFKDYNRSGRTKVCKGTLGNK